MFLKKYIPGFLKDQIKTFLQQRRVKKYKQEAAHIGKAELLDAFTELGISQGDTLFVHSSLKKLGFIEHGPDDIIDAMMEAVGREGTIVFPAFSMNSTMYEAMADQSRVFDPATTPSNVGAITNAFRKREGVIRSIHPTHSVAAWGKHAGYITEGHYMAATNFGADTPFARMLELDCKIVGIATSYAQVTFYHIYEDLHLDRFPGVYLGQRFTCKMRMPDSSIEAFSFLCHNPEYHSNRIEKDPAITTFFTDYFVNNGISVTVNVGQGHIWVMKANDLMYHLDLLYNKGITIYKLIK